MQNFLFSSTVVTGGYRRSLSERFNYLIQLFISRSRTLQKQTNTADRKLTLVLREIKRRGNEPHIPWLPPLELQPRMEDFVDRVVGVQCVQEVQYEHSWHSCNESSIFRFS